MRLALGGRHARVDCCWLVSASVYGYEVAAVSRRRSHRRQGLSFTGSVPIEEGHPDQGQGSLRRSARRAADPRRRRQGRAGRGRLSEGSRRRARPGARRTRRRCSTRRSASSSRRCRSMRAGKIDIVNSDPVLHNTHGFYGQRTAFNLALPDKGMKIASDLPRPGLVRVECDAHGWMLAHIYVADSPVLRADRRRRQLQHHRRAARQLHAGGDAALRRRHRDAGHRQGRRDRQARDRAEEEVAASQRLGDRRSPTLDRRTAR